MIDRNAPTPPLRVAVSRMIYVDMCLSVRFHCMRVNSRVFNY